jgi:organic hydroperoxide reductase OsmC/OhrA
MEAKETYKVFRFESELRWSSALRTTVCSPGKPDLDISSPPEFKGEKGLWTPEDLFVASVNACVLITFLSYARHKRLEIAGYEAEAEGVMEYTDGKYRFTEVSLHPHVAVKSPEQLDAAREAMTNAHNNCLITNSVRAEVKVFPDFRVAPAP